LHAPTSHRCGGRLARAGYDGGALWCIAQPRLLHRVRGTARDAVSGRCAGFYTPGSRLGQCGTGKGAAMVGGNGPFRDRVCANRAGKPYTWSSCRTRNSMSRKRYCCSPMAWSTDRRWNRDRASASGTTSPFWGARKLCEDVGLSV
jgi:hypothetical protein